MKDFNEKSVIRIQSKLDLNNRKLFGISIIKIRMHRLRHVS